MQKHKVYLLLGSNIGNRIQFLEQAKEQINRQIGEIVSQSSFYESEPWGFVDEKPFINQVIMIETALKAHEILSINQTIEKDLGRIRQSNQYTSRKIDIDILFFENMIVYKQGLIIPHSLLHKRRFTLLPLSEIAGGFIHPIFRKSMQEMLDRCSDLSNVKKLSATEILTD
jgi:2-amino-4-hydroxy-6-hydroxymethyldihydropteridine diphosphokinase